MTQDAVHAAHIWTDKVRDSDFGRSSSEEKAQVCCWFGVTHIRWMCKQRGEEEMLFCVAPGENVYSVFFSEEAAGETAFELNC